MDIVSLYRVWDERERYNWCHISSEYESSQGNVVLCITPLRKLFEISIFGISDMYLVLAANAAEIPYKDFGFSYSRKPAFEFNRLFPPITNEATPRGYKQLFRDYQERRWLKQRKKLHPDTLSYNRNRAMNFI